MILWGTPPRAGGAMVTYTDTPVGPYSEIMGIRLLLRGITVPLIAVDSPESVEGGNANWFLPKTLARFSGDAESGRMTVEADGYRVAVSARALGPALPSGGRFTLVQPRPDGSEARSSGRGRGRARPALVRVRVEGDAGPLRSGVFPGAIVTRGTSTLEAPA